MDHISKSVLILRAAVAYLNVQSVWPLIEMLIARWRSNQNFSFYLGIFYLSKIMSGSYILKAGDAGMQQVTANYFEMEMNSYIAQNLNNRICFALHQSQPFSIGSQDAAEIFLL